MKCKYCKNYINEEKICKYCKFEYDEYYTKDDWDILNLDEDYEWDHLQIINRLNAMGLPCIFADIWPDKNIAYLIGCNVQSWRIAQVLGIHTECIYNEPDQAFIILNLYQEKSIRFAERYGKIENDSKN